MIDFEIICRIVDAAKIKTNETILEIGAGKGYLTKALAKEAKKVIAVEIDSKLKKYLKMKKVQVIIGNALENIHNLQFDKIVSNIPYSISEPLINKLIFENFKVAILTIPKAATTEYGDFRYVSSRDSGQAAGYFGRSISKITDKLNG